MRRLPHGRQEPEPFHRCHRLEFEPVFVHASLAPNADVLAPHREHAIVLPELALLTGAMLDRLVILDHVVITVASIAPPTITMEVKRTEG